MFTNYKKLLFAIIFIALTNYTGFSQNKDNQIKGKITDTNAAIVSGANVIAQNKASGREFKTQTNESGEFGFSNLPSGIYTVKVEAVGFSSQTKDISLENGAAVNDFNISLSVGNISETVTVTATRTQLATSDTAVPVSVLTKEEIEQKNVSTIGDALRDLPGVTTVNEGSFQVRPRIRGLDSNRVLVLVDGERLNNGRTSTSNSGIEIGLVDTGQIETLEVVRGSGSVLYGTDALAGTINIITKDIKRNTDGGFRIGSEFSGYYGSNENGRRGSLAVTGSSKFFAFRVAQTLERYENYFAGKSGDLNFTAADGITNDREVLNSQSHGGNTQLTTRFFLDDNNQLKFNYTRRRAADIGSPTLVGVFNAFFPYSDRDKFSAGYEGTNFNKYLARVSANFYFQKQKRNFTNILNVPIFGPFFVRQFSDTVTDTDSTGLDLQSNWLLGSRNFLTAGFSFFRDTNKDERFIETNSPNFAANPPVQVIRVDRSKSVPDSNYGSFAAFAQNQFQVTNRLNLIGGIRVDRFNSKSKPTVGFSLPTVLNQVSPAIIQSLGIDGLENGLEVSQTAVTGDFGVVYKVIDSVSLTGRIGRSFRVPNLFERFFTGAGSVGGFVVGNPDLEPETGINFDAGVKFNNSKVAGSFTYFNNTYKNFLSSAQIFDGNTPVLASQGGLFQTQNIASARIQGFEADIQVPIKLGLGFLTPSGNISYLRGDNLDTNEPLNTITPLKTVLNLRWQNLLSNYYVDFTTRIVNKQKRLSDSFFVGNGGAEPGFATSDIRGGYTYKKERYRMSFNVGITNLFDRFYREQFSFAPARGRSFVFGTTLELFRF